MRQVYRTSNRRMARGILRSMNAPSRASLILLSTLVLAGCPDPVEEVGWELVWTSGNDPEIAMPGTEHDIELHAQPRDLEIATVCYDAPSGVLVEPVCFSLPYAVKHEPVVVTSTAKVLGGAPLGTHDLKVVRPLRFDAGTARLKIVDTLPTGTTPPPGGPPPSISCDPGLWTTGTATVHFETGSVLAQAVDFDITTGGVNAPASVTVPEGASGADFSVTPQGEGFLFVQLVGGEQTFLLEDMRLYGKSEPTLGHHVGSSVSFSRFVPIVADLTYSREETSGLFGATNQLLVQGTFTYDGQAFTLDEYIGSDGEDTLVIPFGTDKLLLTHAFGGPGSVTLSFNRVDQTYINTDSGSFEILHD